MHWRAVVPGGSCLVWYAGSVMETMEKGIYMVWECVAGLGLILGLGLGTVMLFIVARGTTQKPQWFTILGKAELIQCDKVSKTAVRGRPTIHSFTRLDPANCMMAHRCNSKERSTGSTHGDPGSVGRYPASVHYPWAQRAYRAGGRSVGGHLLAQRREIREGWGWGGGRRSFEDITSVRAYYTIFTRAHPRSSSNLDQNCDSSASSVML